MNYSHAEKTLTKKYCQIKFDSDEKEIDALVLMTKIKSKFISVDKNVYIIPTTTCETLKDGGIDILDIVHGKEVLL